METVLRAVLIYIVLFIILRMSDKRTIQESTPFGLILILLISTSVADAMKDDDKSITNAIMQAITLIALHTLMSSFKLGSRKVEKVMGDIPTLLVENGKLREDKMKQSRVTRDNILEAARSKEVLRIEDIKYAILEINGTICVIPKKEEST
jgi:uncharacterized membrane protein YcaP (DUF421 family)